MHTLVLSFMLHCLAFGAVSDSQSMSYLDAQHCLAIAAAFIGIIAACASLIGSANSKADSLTKRIHDAAEEFRKIHDKEAPSEGGTPSGDFDRCAQLKRQMDYYDSRFLTVQHAQHLLFLTIGIFVTCLTIFIGLGLFMIYFQIPDLTNHKLSAGIIFGCIGLFLLFGIGLMARSIYCLYKEVYDSYETLTIEMLPCQQSHCHPTDGGVVSTNGRRPPGIAARPTEAVGG